MHQLYCRPGPWGQAHTRPSTAPSSRATPLKPSSGGSRPCRPAEGFYRWSDLAVGKPIALAGMSLCIVAADAAAEAFYAQKGASLTFDAEHFDGTELLATAANVRCVLRTCHGARHADMQCIYTHRHIYSCADCMCICALVACENSATAQLYVRCALIAQVGLCVAQKHAM